MVTCPHCGGSKYTLIDMQMGGKTAKQKVQVACFLCSGTGEVWAALSEGERAAQQDDESEDDLW